MAAEEYVEKKTETKDRERRKRARTLRSKEREKRKLRKLKEKADFWVVETKESHLSRNYRARRSRHIKRKSNRAVRRAQNLVGKGGGYKKVYDYWWEYI